MGNDSYPVPCTQSGTTVLGSKLLYGLCINKSLVGTLTVKDSVIGLTNSIMGTIAAGTVPGTYHLMPNGGRFQNLCVILSGADDVTAYVRQQ